MGFLSDLFGGGQGDPGLSTGAKSANAQSWDQTSRLLDAFYGSNYRKSYGSNYGSRGTGAEETSKAGWGDTFARFNYSPQSGSGTGGAAGGSASTGGNTGLWGGNTPYGNAPILQQIMQAATQGIGENQRTLSDYNRGAEGAIRTAQKYGTGQNAVIDADSAKALADANAITLARMNASGLGGSTLTNDQMGANAAGNIREKLRAKADLADRATGVKLQQKNIANQGRAGLQTAMNASSQALRMSPIEAQLRVLQGQVVNPFSPSTQSAPQDTSALSGLGSVLGSVAGFATGGGFGDILGGLGDLFGGGGSFPIDASYSGLVPGSNRPR